MSLIHYKFKSAKDYNTITFDGLTISLFELKRDILIDSKLKGSDFDIIISNAQSEEGSCLPLNAGLPAILGFRLYFILAMPSLAFILSKFINTYTRKPGFCCFHDSTNPS